MSVPDFSKSFLKSSLPPTWLWKKLMWQMERIRGMLIADVANKIILKKFILLLKMTSQHFN